MLGSSGAAAAQWPPWTSRASQQGHPSTLQPRARPLCRSRHASSDASRKIFPSARYRDIYSQFLQFRIWTTQLWGLKLTKLRFSLSFLLPPSPVITSCYNIMHTAYCYGTCTCTHVAHLSLSLSLMTSGINIKYIYYNHILECQNQKANQLITS